MNTDRLSVVDEIFLRAHRGLGTPIVMQGLWLTENPIDRPALTEVHHHLARGPLGRRVVRSRMPGARPRWVPSTNTLPIIYSAATDALTWADAQGANLDPSVGPGWRLSACEVPDGRSLISLVSSHVLADARGLIHAVDEALHGISNPVKLARSADVDDARQVWRTVFREFRPRPQRSAATDKPLARTYSGPPTSAIFTFNATDFDRAAHEAGATPNSLFVNTVASMLYASGYPRRPVVVSLPVDTRPPGAPVVGNALAMGSATLDPSDSPADTRVKCGDGFGRRMSAPAGIPEEFLHVLPERLAYRATKGAGELDILCSNIGRLPESMHHVGTAVPRAIAARAIHPGLTSLPRTRLSGYLCQHSDRYTLSLVSLDPDHIRSREQLHAVAMECLPVPGAAW